MKATIKTHHNGAMKPDNRTEEQKRWFSTYYSRDLAEKILTNIANSADEEIILMDRENIAKDDDGRVKYSYVINLKENTFGVYKCLDQEPMKVYKLDELPEEDVFVSELKAVEEEEDKWEDFFLFLFHESQSRSGGRQLKI